MRTGKVYLVGAGPGDPELVTVKALRTLGEAEVVVYDRLVSEEVLGHAPGDAEKIYVGKGPEGDSATQEHINSIMIQKAREGKRVVRLKSGDPFIFGRGGEEALALAASGIPFEVVPGVSSAYAAPSSALIPVTHRDVASSVVVVTGHEADGRTERRVDWRRTAGAADTIVVLMGVANLERIASELIRGGRDGRTPTALIENASTPRMRTVVSTLEDIADEARKEGVGPPAVLVVGEVVGLRERLAGRGDG